ncbi:MAG: NTP transferase domain-containing protein, partial [Hyphomicrobium sp.]
MTVAGVILAAGRSARMAPRNKLLETIGRQPIIARVAEVALAS